MIIDTKTVIVTLITIGIASYAGLQFIRQFALSIAQENHDANLANDMTEEARRAKRERDADAAASAAFAKVEPLLPASVVTKGTSLAQGQGSDSTAKKIHPSKTPVAPSSGGVPLVAKSKDGTKSPPASGGLVMLAPAKNEVETETPLGVDEESNFDNYTDQLEKEIAAEIA